MILSFNSVTIRIKLFNDIIPNLSNVYIDALDFEIDLSFSTMICSLCFFLFKFYVFSLLMNFHLSIGIISMYFIFHFFFIHVGFKLQVGLSCVFLFILLFWGHIIALLTYFIYIYHYTWQYRVISFSTFLSFSLQTLYTFL